MANHWFAFYGGDYEADTGHLSLVEHGVYLKFMLHYYRTESPLPEDCGQLRKICRAHTQDEMEGIASVLKQFFVLRKSGWRNNRIEQEIKRLKTIKKRYVERAKIAAAKRYRRQEDTCLKQVFITPQAVINELDPHPHPHITQRSKPKAKAQSAFVIPDWISQQSWNEYEEMRVLIRKPMTPAARTSAVRTLEKLRTAGQDVAAVLNQSVFNSWQGLFEIRRSGHESDRQPTQERKPDKPDLSAQADPDCRACYGGGYEHKEGKIIPCGCTRRALAGRPDRQPGGSQALGDSRTEETRFTEENPGRILGKAAVV